MNNKDTKLISEAYDEVRRYDTLRHGIIDQLHQNPDILKRIAIDQGIEDEINFSDEEQAVWEVFDLVFNGLMKDDELDEVESMALDYGLDLSIYQ